jgi:plasmid stabilization system protein ParE
MVKWTLPARDDLKAISILAVIHGSRNITTSDVYK